MWRQPTILRRGPQAGFLHRATAFFKSRLVPLIPMLARRAPHRGPQQILVDVADLIRKTW